MLFDYNVWANHLVRDKAAEVSEADYLAPVDYRAACCWRRRSVNQVM